MRRGRKVVPLLPSHCQRHAQVAAQQVGAVLMPVPAVPGELARSDLHAPTVSISRWPGPSQARRAVVAVGVELRSDRAPSGHRWHGGRSPPSSASAAGGDATPISSPALPQQFGRIPIAHRAGSWCIPGVEQEAAEVAPRAGSGLEHLLLVRSPGSRSRPAAAPAGSSARRSSRSRTDASTSPGERQGGPVRAVGTAVYR